MAMQQFEPMSTSGILDRAFRLYRTNFVRFIAIVSVVEVPLGLGLTLLMVLVWAGLRQDAGGDLEGGPAPALAIGGIGFILWAVVSMVGQQLASAALLKSIAERYLGRDVSVGQAYRFVFPRLLTLIGAALLVGLICGLGYVLCVVPGVIFSLWYALTTPAIVVENLRAITGMNRSKDLAKGNLGKIFLVLLVVVLITWVATMLASWIGQLLNLFVFAANPLAGTFVTQVIGLIPQILVMPIGSAATVLLYYDLRIRKEGFDLEMLAQSMGSEEAASDAHLPPV